MKDAQASNAPSEKLFNLARRCKIAKDAHFFASRRAQRCHLLFGVPVIAINVVVGSTLFALLSNDLPNTFKWVGALLALMAATCGAIQTFFGFDQRANNHRRLGNRYIALLDEIECTLCKPYEESELLDSLTRLVQRFAQLNSDAEAVSFSEEDYRKAANRLSQETDQGTAKTKDQMT